MSIVDAINRAKKMAEANQPPRSEPRGDSRQARQARRASVPGAAGSALALQDKEEDTAKLALTPIRPLPLEIDLRRCLENRVLVPGTERQIDSSVETAYRMLRTRVAQRARANNWTTIGVTSASPGDGKTLTAINLALSFAREESNDVALLDLDMRNPSVCDRLGVTPPASMREYFEGNVTADQLFMSIGVKNLVIAAGVQPSDRSSELLSSNRFEELLSRIRSSAPSPLIVVDLPPVLNTDDALVLAPRLDAILIVTSESKTSREDLERATDLMSEFNLAGYVLNRSRQTVTGYGYY